MDATYSSSETPDSALTYHEPSLKALHPYDYWHGYIAFRRSSLTINWLASTTITHLVGIVASWLGPNWSQVITTATDFIIHTFNSKFSNVYGAWDHAQNTKCYLLVKERATLYTSSSYSVTIGTPKNIIKEVRFF